AMLPSRDSARADGLPGRPTARRSTTCLRRGVDPGHTKAGPWLRVQVVPPVGGSTWIPGQNPPSRGGGRWRTGWLGGRGRGCGGAGVGGGEAVLEAGVAELVDRSRGA